MSNYKNNDILKFYTTMFKNDYGNKIPENHIKTICKSYCESNIFIHDRYFDLKVIFSYYLYKKNEMEKNNYHINGDYILKMWNSELNEYKREFENWVYYEKKGSPPHSEKTDKMYSIEKNKHNIDENLCKTALTRAQLIKHGINSHGDYDDLHEKLSNLLIQ